MTISRMLQLSTHEAGHAVAYFVLGRPIDRAYVRPPTSAVVPVAGTSDGYLQDAIVAASAWAAEKRLYCLRLSPEDAHNEIQTAWFEGGADDDYEQLERFLAEKLTEMQEAEIEALADSLVARFWDLVEEVSAALTAETEIGQPRLEECGRIIGVRCGEAAADYLRTGKGS